MLVGGEYKNSGTTTWYRIDFVNRENEGTPRQTMNLSPSSATGDTPSP